jgi:hypothetical protein
MQLSWRGGNASPVLPCPEEIVEEMTAIAIVWHPAGFALAADGRFRWGAPPAPNAIEHTFPVDREQKIFPFDFKGRTMAFALTGASANNLGTFNVVTHLFGSLHDGNRTCNSVYELVTKASKDVKIAIEEARNDGRLPSHLRDDPNVANEDGTFNVTTIFLAGYFSKKKPTLARVRLFHKNQVLAEPALQFHTPPAYSQFSGSTIIYKILFDSTDERFDKYRVLLSPESTIKDVIACATGYVEACSSPIAVSVDPICNAIGGHIHSASITATQGFEWIQPPLIRPRRKT